MTDKRYIHQKYLTLHLHGFHSAVDCIALRKSFAIYGPIKSIHTWSSLTQKQHAFIIFRDRESVGQATRCHRGPFQAENIVHNETLQSILRTITSKIPKKAAPDSRTSDVLSPSQRPASRSSHNSNAHEQRLLHSDKRATSEERGRDTSYGWVSDFSRSPKSAKRYKLEEKTKAKESNSSSTLKRDATMPHGINTARVRRPMIHATGRELIGLDHSFEQTGNGLEDMASRKEARIESTRHYPGSSITKTIQHFQTKSQAVVDGLGDISSPQTNEEDEVEKVLCLFREKFKDNAFETNRQASFKVTEYAAKHEYGKAERLGLSWLQFINDQSGTENPLFTKPIHLTLASVNFTRAKMTHSQTHRSELLAAAQDLISKAEDRPGSLDFFKLKFLVDFTDSAESSQGQEPLSGQPSDTNPSVRGISGNMRLADAHIAFIESIHKRTFKDMQGLRALKREADHVSESERQKRRRTEGDLDRVLCEQRAAGKAMEDETRVLLTMLQEEKARRVKAEDDLWLLRRRRGTRGI